MQTTPRVRELARDTAIEAARAYMAAHLRAERQHGAADLTIEEADALQALRDCLAAERATR